MSRRTIATERTNHDRSSAWLRRARWHYAWWVTRALDRCRSDAGRNRILRTASERARDAGLYSIHEGIQCSVMYSLLRKVWAYKTDKRGWHWWLEKEGWGRRTHHGGWQSFKYENRRKVAV